MRIACLQHAAFEGPGVIGPWARAREFPLRTLRLFANQPPPALDSFDLLVVLGGPMSVSDEASFQWLRGEKQWIRSAVEQGKRVLGICLGAQLIASVLGARVFANREREIGWWPVEQVPGARPHAGFSPLPPRFEALHWHGETFDLPDGASWLARSDGCAHQAFAIGDRVLGLQFHLESTPESVDALIQNCPGDLEAGPFVQDPHAMISAGEQFQESNRLMAMLLDRFVRDT